MRRTMESVAAERLNKIGIRDQNFVGNGSASDNEATSVSQDAQEMSAIVSALGTILILCQQKDWIGRFGKWQFLLTFRTKFMLT